MTTNDKVTAAIREEAARVAAEMDGAISAVIGDKVTTGTAAGGTAGTAAAKNAGGAKGAKGAAKTGGGARGGAQNRVGDAEVAAALEELRRYRAAREGLNARIRENRSYWKMTRRGGGGEPTTGWLFNSVINRHADAMDAPPSPRVLPREADDEDRARLLSQILPAILDNCDYEQLYSDLWWSKLIDGFAIIGVYWSPEAAAGRGDVSLERLDPLNVYWEPGISDIRYSRSVYVLERVHNSNLIERWPYLASELRSGGASGERGEYTTVIGRYYRRGGELHFMRIACGKLLYASENDPTAAGGWYAHGQYPFVFDVMYPDEGALTGFGAVDAAKSAQSRIDRLEAAIMKNALVSARPRYFVRLDGGVSEEEFADPANELVHVASSALGEDSIRQITAAPLGEVYPEILKMKINELKETTGNRDFTQGFTTDGVTSGVAITALQESGNKLARDIIKGSYRALSRVCLLVIELIRQFYVAPRSFRVTEGGSCRCMRWDNSAICPVHGEDGLDRTPLFDVRVEQCKAAPPNRETANERAVALWNEGFFLPEKREQALAALEIMDFDGKEKLAARLAAGEGAS